MMMTRRVVSAGDDDGDGDEGVDCAEKKIRTPLWMWGNKKTKMVHN